MGDALGLAGCQCPWHLLEFRVNLPEVLRVSIEQSALLYVHGFNSSPASVKASQLVRLFADLGLADRLQVPALHHDPRRAIAQLEQAIAELGQPVLMGSSLGGYYSTYLAERHQLKAILLNPAVRAYRLAEPLVGQQQNLPNGDTWQMTTDHLAGFKALNVSRPSLSRYQVWLQTGDETLDYRDAEAFYQGSELHVLPGGNHGFEHFVSHLPAMLAFAGFDADLLSHYDLSTL